MKKPSTIPFQLPPGLKPGAYTLRADGTVVPAVFEPSKPLKRYKRDPLENHPRAVETRELMRKAMVTDEVEVMDLQASDLACYIADLWVKARHASDLTVSYNGRLLAQQLMRLELVTRPSAMRKVRP